MAISQTIIEQYRQLKADAPDYVLLMQVGVFMPVMDDDARAVPQIMEAQRRGPAAHPYNVQPALERFERGHIANILELTRWNQRKTAQMLGISAEVLASKMPYYQLLADKPYGLD